MDDDEFLLPPGCMMSILPHPSEANAALEVALFCDHRYAFFFWARWRNAIGTDAAPPILITLDWHEDLSAPGGNELTELVNLNLRNPRDVALFCWEGLSPLNDGQVLAAAYLNLIGDVYVLRKQDGDGDDSFVDAGGNVHRIRCFREQDHLMAELSKLDAKYAFFDLDLDYFTESPHACGGGDNVSLVPDEVVSEMVSPEGRLMQWIFPRMAGMTVATEPEFCGGLENSNHLQSLISSCLFAPQLLHGRSTWKHLAA
jgi:hypothetical protein